MRMKIGHCRGSACPMLCSSSKVKSSKMMEIGSNGYLVSMNPRSSSLLDDSELDKEDLINWASPLTVRE